MLIFDVLFFVLFFCVGFVCCCPPRRPYIFPQPKKISPPQWSSSYKVEAEIYFSLADVKVPAKVWYDGSNGRVRVDYEGGPRSYYYQSHDAEDLVHISVHPETTKNETNKMHCYVTVGVEDIVDDEKNILLPDMTQYKLIGRENLFGLKAYKWQFTEDATEDTMWVAYVRHPRGQVRVRPLRFQRRLILLNQSMVLQSEYIDYSNYEATEFYKFDDTFNAIDEPCKIQVSQESRTAQDEFDGFKSEHGKRYTSEEEHDHRRHIFRRNLRNIEAHNRAGRGFKLAVNHLADRTPQELFFMKGLLRTGPVHGGLPFPYNQYEIDQISKTMPDNWDWRLHGAVTPVKQQLFCGACWAFSAVGVVEGALHLHSRRPVERLSEQALVDCSWGPDRGTPNHGCMGGVTFTALEWIKEHGLPRYLDYGGYLGMNGFCHIGNITDVVTITDWVRVPPVNENALRLAIFKHGPVSASVNVRFAFQFYSQGVFYDESCSSSPSDLDHSVLVIGYGVLDGQKYWLVKNTWGSAWGDQGYILMASKGNNCGLQHETAYVTLD